MGEPSHPPLPSTTRTEMTVRPQEQRLQRIGDKLPADWKPNTVICLHELMINFFGTFRC